MTGHPKELWAFRCKEWGGAQWCRKSGRIRGKGR